MVQSRDCLVVVVSFCSRRPWLARDFEACGNRNNSNGGINNVGGNGNYWSAAANSTANAYNLNFNSTNVNPTNNNNRANGFSVVPVLSPLATI